MLIKDEIFLFGEYRLEVRERRIWRGEEVVSLSPKDFALLVIMVQAAGRLLEKDYLIRSVWPDSYVHDANLSVHIASIRKALGKTSDVEQFIETVPKVGYRFVMPVARHFEDESDLETIQKPAVTEPQDLPLAEDRPPVIETSSLSRSLIIKGRHRTLSLFLSALIVTLGIAVLFAAHLSSQKNSGAENSTRPLASPPGLFLQPAFSPDGQELAYTWRTGTSSHQSIYLQHVLSEDRKILIDTGQDDYSPSWSPNGSEIAFLHSVGDDRAMEVVIAKRQNAAQQRKVTAICNANDAFRNPPTLSWSPDARTLVTTDCGSGNQSPSLVLVSVDTGQKRPLTHAPPRTVDDQAAFSPDGSLVTFRRSQGDSSDEIYVIPSTGGAERKLTSRSNPVDGLAWSSDGRNIVFSSGRSTSLGNIWSIPLTGGPPTAVTTPLTHTSSPTVSPVGHRMAYVNSPINVSVWRLRIDGHDGASEAEPFIASNFFDASAVYSPDGERIAFRSDRSGTNEIWICQSDGSEPKRITHFNGPMTGSPRWSPDGRSIAFDSTASGRADIYSVNLEDGKTLRLTASALTNSDNVVPAWSHDGNAVYFSSNRTGSWQIWKHALASGSETQITVKGGFDAMESKDGNSLFYVGDMETTGIHRLSLLPDHNDLPVASLGPGIWHAWTISNDALFYLKRPAPSLPAILYRLDLGSGTVRALGKTAQAANDSISISSGGQWAIFARRTNTNSSIMILDGWN